MSTPEGNLADLGPEASAEIVALLSDIVFSDRHAALQDGPCWSIYAHPWLGERPDFFDALISISHRSDAAASARGLALSLRRGNIIWLTDEVTDARGHVWFRDLPAGEYRLELASSPLSLGETNSESHPAKRVPAVESSEAELAAASAKPEKPAPSAARAPRWRLFHPPDRRLTALLEEHPDTGRTTLLLTTAEAALAEAKVQYVVGEQTDSVRLARDETTGRWSASVSLRGDFSTLASAIPRFAVAPA